METLSPAYDTCVLAAIHLVRLFGARTAVDDVTFEVHAGEVFGLLGPNGAGKTTTLRMLGGLISPSSGHASIAGVPLTPARMDDVRGKVGFLTESPGLWDRLTVRMNLLVYARLHGVPDPERAVRTALGLFGLDDRGDSLAAQLSKGMKQKVALARALMHDPPVVLLDEPTSGLDPQTARLVRHLIIDLRDRGRTIVISTHNLDEAERVATRIGVLQRRLIALDTPDGLRRRLFGHRVRVTVTAEPGRFAEIATAAGGLHPQAFPDGFWVDLDGVEEQTPALVRALVNAGASILAITPDRPPLEDVYLTLIAGGAGEEHA